MNQSSSQRDPNILVSVDRGEIFEGTLSEWENTFGHLSNFSDDELVIFLHDWAEDQGYDIKVMNSFQERFWIENLRELSLPVLNHMLNHRQTNPEYQKITYNQKVINLIKEELILRNR